MGESGKKKVCQPDQNLCFSEVTLIVHKKKSWWDQE